MFTETSLYSWPIEYRPRNISEEALRETEYVGNLTCCPGRAGYPFPFLQYKYQAHSKSLRGLIDAPHLAPLDSLILKLTSAADM